MEIENEELTNLNKEFISSSESFLITFKMENEAPLNFAEQCRRLLIGDNDKPKLDSANLDKNLAENGRLNFVTNRKSGRLRWQRSFFR